MTTEYKQVNRQKRSEEGFTLLEIMIAMVCFTIAALALTSLNINTWSSVTSARSSTEASVLGAKVFESIMSRKYTDQGITSGSHTFIENGYTVTYTIGDNAVLPLTKYVQLDVSYNLGSSVKNTRMHYLIPEIIR